MRYTFGSEWDKFLISFLINSGIAKEPLSEILVFLQNYTLSRSTPARIWKGQGATGQKGTVIRETEYLNSRKSVKISSPIQFQLTIIPKIVFLAIKFNKTTAKLSDTNVATCLVTSLKEI